MACKVCRFLCAQGQFTGSSFMIELKDDHLDSLIVPCNIREEFNELVGNIVDFDVHGTTYKIRVKKERKKTYFYGEQLVSIIATYNLSGGDLIHFSMAGPQPRIVLLYMGEIASEDSESIQVDGGSEEVIWTRRTHGNMWWLLKEPILASLRKDRVLQKLPQIDSYIGVPFVHRITNTNISNGHVMKIPMAVADSAGMEQGTIGVRRGESGNVTAVPITSDNADGRVILNSQAWRQFHSARVGMEAGRAILITMRNSDIPNLDMMMVIDYISAR